MTRARFGAPFLLLSTIACATQGESRCEDIPAARGFARFDTAGVEVVVNATPAWETSTALHVAPAPAVTIGVTHGDAAYEFSNIRDATRLPDGRIVIADAQLAELRVFDENGRFLMRIGGKGSGPGEYQTIAGLYRANGDTLWVEDRGNRRLTKLTPEGQVVATLPVAWIPWTRPARVPGGRPLSGASALVLRGLLGDSALLATHTSNQRAAEEVSRVERSRFVLRRLDPYTDQRDSLGLMLGVESYIHFFPDGSFFFGETPFGNVESLAVADGRYYYGEGDAFEIEEHASDGRLRRLIRVCEQPERVDPDRMEALIAERLAPYTGEILRYEETAMRGSALPDSVPAYMEMQVDAADRLWVRRFAYEGAPVWMVFDRDGRWLGDVETPDGLALLEIGADYLLGVARTEDDVPMLRLHRID
jgi:hypothetical protein